MLLPELPEGNHLIIGLLTKLTVTIAVPLESSRQVTSEVETTNSGIIICLFTTRVPIQGYVIVKLTS